MEWKTWLTERTGIKYPLIAGALHRIGTSALAAPFSEAGGRLLNYSCKSYACIMVRPYHSYWDSTQCFFYEDEVSPGEPLAALFLVMHSYFI